MKNRYEAKEVFIFTNSTFVLTDEIKSKLKASNNPNIILFYGTPRSGKSTLCNTVLRAEVNPDGFPFESDEGNEPVTIKCQYCIIKLSELLQKFNLKIDLDFDSDLFIIDSEGIGSLGEATESLRKAVFSILQISTVNIFVTKNLDRTNISEMKALFTMPQLIPGSQQKLNKSCAIVQVDIGVPGHPKEEEYETKRKENDSKELEKFLSHLQENKINISKENIAFFAQPKWNKENHYIESIKDLIKFIVKGISQRMKIPGKNLVDIYEKVVPIISNIDELNNPDIGLNIIVQKLINNYFELAYNYSIEILNSLIKTKISNKSAQDLIELSKINFDDSIKTEVLKSYKEKANEIFENIFEIFPEQYQQYMNKIKEKVEKATIETFETCCKSIVLPFMIKEVTNSIKTMIYEYFEKQNSDSLRSIDLQKLINQYQQEGNREFISRMNSVSSSLNSQPEFITSLNQVQSTISDEVIETNKNRCEECPPYPTNLEEARKAGQLGEQVRIWPENQNGKSAIFNVTKDNKLEVPGLEAIYSDTITKDGLSHICTKSSNKIEVEIDIKQMAIIVLSKKILEYSEESYRNSVFGQTHTHIRVQKIEIKLQDPFCFPGGSKYYSLAAFGLNVDVRPINFQIQ